MIPLSPDEEKILSPILQRFSENARHGITLEYLVRGWDEFTREVEAGYRLTGYDYTNDLSLRELLDQITLEVPAALRDRLLRNYLDPADARLRNSSRPIAKPVFGAPDNPKWWWLRAPNDLSGMLAADLLTEDGWEDRSKD